MHFILAARWPRVLPEGRVRYGYGRIRNDGRLNAHARDYVHLANRRSIG